MDVGPFLVADAQPAEGMEPGDGAFDDPAVSTQPLGSIPGNTRIDAALGQVVTAKRKVVSLVGVQFDLPATGPGRPETDRAVARSEMKCRESVSVVPRPPGE